MPGPIRRRGLLKSVRELLRYDRWQTASLVSAQMAIPPEAIAREMTRKQGYNKTAIGAASGLVAQTLSELVFRGCDIERRKNENGKWEYRLKAKEFTDGTDSKEKQSHFDRLNPDRSRDSVS